MNCRTCDKDLSSRIENDFGTCFVCLKDILENQNAVRDELTRLRINLEDASRKKTDAVHAVEKVRAFLKAETEGVKAAETGAPDDQNPYPDGTEHCVMWLNGWQSVEARRRTQQATAVVDWAGRSLKTTAELALGYGQKEIADKIGTVIEKLEQFSAGG